MAITYTDQERQTLRTAAFGAVYLVSSAEPGFLDTVKESLAGSRAFAKASELRDVLRTGGLPKMPMGSRQEIEREVITALSESQRILEAKGPEQVQEFRTAVTQAVDEVARAAGGGASPSEQDAISKIKAALGTT
jgi:broad specificity phosphatase PhoE